MPLSPKDNEDLDSRCAIEIVSINYAEQDYVYFTKVLAKLARHMAAGVKITLNLNKRSERDGSMEWGAMVTYSTGRFMYIGILQRKAGDDPEFHT